MRVLPITCSSNGCHGLVHNATPILYGAATATFNVKEFCSRRCSEQQWIDSFTCQASGCFHMVAWETGKTTADLSNFDISKYCTVKCARQHYKESPLEASLPMSTCTVCTEDKPLSSFVHIVQPAEYDKDDWLAKTNMPLPAYCRDHIMPEHTNLKTGICISCISQYLEVRFETDGVYGLWGGRCISNDCDYMPYIHGPEYEDWQVYGYYYLPVSLQPLYQQGALDLWLDCHATKWECPACPIEDFYIERKQIQRSGYPQVHCHGCKDRFCFVCRVPWHRDVTCTEYQAQHPLERDETDEQVLALMAQAGARRCPFCQWLTIKGYGCGHVQCPNCRSSFTWGKAERVVPLGANGGTDKDIVWQGDCTDEIESVVSLGYDTSPIFPSVVCEMDNIIAKRRAREKRATAKRITRLWLKQNLETLYEGSANKQFMEQCFALSEYTMWDD